MRHAGRRRKTALVLNGTVVLSSLTGLIVNAIRTESFMSASSLLFFTIQSNIWIALICFLFFVCDLFGFGKEDWFYTVKFMFTASILFVLLAGGLLAACADGWSGRLSVDKITLYVISPLAALASFLLTDAAFDVSRMRVALTALIMPLYYFGFSMTVAFLSPEPLFAGRSGGLSHFPYFFLDFERQGWLTMKGGLDGLGTLWWLLLLGLSVLAIGFLLVIAQRAVQRRIGRAA